MGGPRSNCPPRISPSDGSRSCRRRERTQCSTGACCCGGLRRQRRGVPDVREGDGAARGGSAADVHGARRSRSRAMRAAGRGGWRCAGLTGKLRGWLMFPILTVNPGVGANGKYRTCEPCVTMFGLDDVAETSQPYYATGGTINIAGSIPTGRSITATIEDDTDHHPVHQDLDLVNSWVVNACGDFLDGQHLGQRHRLAGADLLCDAWPVRETPRHRRRARRPECGARACRPPGWVASLKGVSDIRTSSARGERPSGMMWSLPAGNTK
ncbi:MAG: hypothetical protein ACJATT_005940 [Myxococcota bacterium]|jgi:hypothetical protein